MISNNQPSQAGSSETARAVEQPSAVPPHDEGVEAEGEEDATGPEDSGLQDVPEQGMRLDDLPDENIHRLWIAEVRALLRRVDVTSSERKKSWLQICSNLWWIYPDAPFAKGCIYSLSPHSFYKRPVFVWAPEFIFTEDLRVLPCPKCPRHKDDNVQHEGFNHKVESAALDLRRRPLLTSHSL